MLKHWLILGSGIKKRVKNFHFIFYLPVEWHSHRHQLVVGPAHSDVSNEIHAQVTLDMLSLLLRNNDLHDHRTLFQRKNKRNNNNNINETNCFYQHSSIIDYEFVFDLIKRFQPEKEIPFAQSPERTESTLSQRNNEQEFNVDNNNIHVGKTAIQ